MGKSSFKHMRFEYAVCKPLFFSLLCSSALFTTVPFSFFWSVDLLTLISRLSCVTLQQHYFTSCVFSSQPGPAFVGLRANSSSSTDMRNFAAHSNMALFSFSLSKINPRCHCREMGDPSITKSNFFAWRTACKRFKQDGDIFLGGAHLSSTNVWIQSRSRTNKRDAVFGWLSRSWLLMTLTPGNPSRQQAAATTSAGHKRGSSMSRWDETREE